MDERSLQRKILDMKAELTNLKTAHLHGMGSFEFFTKEASITLAHGLTNTQATVTFLSGSIFPPLVQATAFNDLGEKVSLSAEMTSNSFVYTFVQSQGRTVTVSVVASVPIQSITIVES